MIINSGNLNAIRVGFNAAYKAGLGKAEPQFKRIATTVPSSTRENKYGWLGKMPSMREWIGARVVHNMAEHDYSIKNLTHELTIGVDRDDIRDDNLGVYTPMFQEMGESVGAKSDMMVFEALKKGFTSDCYDGQFFFDIDHPVLDANGDVTTVANTDGGAGVPWYLLSTKRALKPIIFQEREKAAFVARDNPNDSNVFNNKEFQYGSDGRWNVGYGFWQMAWGSKQTLDAAHFETAFAAIEGMKGDHGRPLGLTPDLLVVPPSLRSKGLELLNAERNAAGATNVWKDTAELMVVPWLA